jgi:hypothetical protein
MKDIIRRILKEDVNNTLYDKIIKVMRRPYVDFLRKNGLGDKKTVEEIMKRKLGDGNIKYIPNYNNSQDRYTFEWNTENRGYYDENNVYPNDGEVIWNHAEQVEEKRRSGGEIVTLKKTIESDGTKDYFELTDDRSEIKHDY